MEENKEIKVRLSTVIIIILLIVICLLGYLVFNVKQEYNNLLAKSVETQSVLEQNGIEKNTVVKEEPDLETVLDKIYIAPKFIMASDSYTKELFVRCSDTTARVNKDNKLEVTVGTDKFVVEEIEEEIIDIKLGIVNQHDGKDDINTSFVRDVFVLTKYGDVYAINITYGYRPDLVSKILEDVVKLENVQRIGIYDDQNALPDSVVVAKKIDNTITVCDDGERDGL